MRREETIIQQSPLPSGYTQLKWLESNSNTSSRISCDFYGNVNWKISGELSFSSNIGGNFASICGSGSGTSRQCNSLYSPNLKRFDTCFGVYVAYTLSQSHTYNDVIAFEYDKNGGTFGGETFTSSSSSGSQSNLPFYLFAFDGNYRVPYCRLYWLDIKDQNNQLIHSFLPAMRDYDSKLGMYDIVANKFYQVTGTFTYGTL